MLSLTYLLTEAVQFEELVKKSRFFTQVVPLHHSSEAPSRIAELAALGATHNCWAWKVGAEYRFSDDGEPGGTAGRPMLAVIEQQEFDQVLALCSRWFGGIKLGTGGLQRAYGSGVNQCLRHAPKQLFVPTTTLQGYCPYSEISLLQARLSELGVSVAQQLFDAQGATFTVLAPLPLVAACQHLLQQLTNGAYAFVPWAE